MVNIVIFGKKADYKLSDFLARLLALRQKQFQFLRDGVLFQNQHTMSYVNYMLVDTEDLRAVEKIPVSLFILKEACAPVFHEELLREKGSLVILNNETRGLLKGSDNPVLSCGASSKDTVTFASLASDGILSIQRGFRNLKGETVEMQDISVHMELCGESAYEQLAAFAALLYCGIL